MTENLFNLDALFAYTVSAPLAAEDEATLVRTVQAGEDHDGSATMTILHAYGSPIRAAVSRTSSLKDVPNPLDVEDARMVAIQGALEAIRAHDPAKGRLAGTINAYVADAIKREGGAATSVPPRTLTRFFGILREADGDIGTARELAPSREMATATFDQVLAAVRPDSIDALRDPDGEGYDLREIAAQPVFASSPVVDVEDRILCDAALRACDDDEHRVVSLQYGFSPVVEIVDGERVQVDRLPSDREIGDILGMTRPTVQRRGKSALVSMRKALCVNVGDAR